ncbi:MAG: hypothetical protein AMJ55_12370 [Gammaproteobacteria bacterium SG8_15]|nr:MAG: hypothetical protein AMJ55_12370 [Gammaproteobacteria bacterium SG8_15]
MFEARDRTAQVTVVNSGDETGTYRIELVNKRMTDAGTFENIEEPGEGDLFADKMLRYSPRQVVLAHYQYIYSRHNPAWKNQSVCKVFLY